MMENLLYILGFCDIICLSTDGYTLDELEFEWRNDASELQIDPDLQLPQFTLTTWDAEKCRKFYITGGYQGA